MSQSGTLILIMSIAVLALLLAYGIGPLSTRAARLFGILGICIGTALTSTALGTVCWSAVFLCASSLRAISYDATAVSYWCFRWWGRG